MEDIINETRQHFDGLIFKPKMSDKLLGKPPFRFLHDIISNVNKETGFGEGLYEGEELNGKAIRGKGPKIAYLNKIIALVGLAQGTPVDVNPNKVVAGKEPERTNGFLQQLAICAKESASDNDTLVERVLNGETPGSGGGRIMKQSSSKKGSTEGKISLEESKSTLESEPKKPKKRRERIQEPEDAPPSQEQSDFDLKNTVETGSRERESKDEGKHQIESRRPQSPEMSKFSEVDSTPKHQSSKHSDEQLDLSVLTGDLEECRERISAIISKPRLSDKLLGKPPFRFLFDVITNICNARNYQTELYGDDEKNSKAIKGKEMKIGYLQKIVDAVNADLGVICDINLSKVVAGKETEKTRRFLEYLVVAATGSTDISSNTNSSTSRIQNTDSSLSAMAHLSTREEKESQNSRISDVDMDTKQDVPSKPRRPSKSKKKSSATEFEAPSERPRTQRLARPTTARRRPPTVRENVRKVSDLKNIDPDAEVGNVITEDAKDSEDDSDDEQKESKNDDFRLDSQADDYGGNKSKLVREIEAAETNRADEAKRAENSESKKTSQKKGIRMGRVGKKQKSGRKKTTVNVKELRIGIQKLCKSTNPLDMEMMKKELIQWRCEYEKYTAEFEDIERSQEDEIKGLYAELEAQEKSIKDQMTKINTVKAKIARNDSRIAELLQMVINAYQQ